MQQKQTVKSKIEELVSKERYSEALSLAVKFAPLKWQKRIIQLLNEKTESKLDQCAAEMGDSPDVCEVSRSEIISQIKSERERLAGLVKIGMRQHRKVLNKMIKSGNYNDALNYQRKHNMRSLADYPKKYPLYMQFKEEKDRELFIESSRGDALRMERELALSTEMKAKRERNIRLYLKKHKSLSSYERVKQSRELGLGLLDESLTEWYRRQLDLEVPDE